MEVRKISLREAYTPGGTASGDEPYKAFERCEQQVAERDTDDNGETNDEINTNNKNEKSDISYRERLMLDALILVLACLLRFHIYALVEILGGTVTGVASAIGVPIGQVVGQVARPFLWLSGFPLTIVYKTIELMLTVIGWMGQACVRACGAYVRVRACACAPGPGMACVRTGQSVRAH